MNFSEYLKTCNTDETSLNEGVGGFADIVNTKEFYVWFNKLTANLISEYDCVTEWRKTSSGAVVTMTAEAHSNVLPSYTLKVGLDDNVNVTNIDFIPSSSKIKYKQMNEFEKEVSTFFSNFVSEINKVIAEVKKYVQKVNK